jgi:type III secretion protein U
VPKSAETVSSAFFVGVCVALAVGLGTLFARLQALFRLVFDAAGAADPAARLAVLVDGAARDWALLSAQIVAAAARRPARGLRAGRRRDGMEPPRAAAVAAQSGRGLKNMWSMRNS